MGPSLFVAEAKFRTPAREAFDSAAAAAGLTGALAEPRADPAADGIPNLLRHAFNVPLNSGTTPVITPSTGTSGLPLVSVFSPDGPLVRVRVEFVRRKGAGIAYEPQTLGPSDGEWRALDIEPEVIAVDGSWERVIYDTQVNAGASPSILARVLVRLD